jgi:nitroreductase
VELGEVVRRRRMVRRFDPRPLPAEVLDRILHSATRAPSAGFSQGLDLLVYLDRYGAPDKAGLGMDSEEGWPVPYWDMDAAMAVMLMLLTAVDEGVGAWWFGVFHGAEALLRDLGVPPGRRLVGAVALGWPAGDDRPSGSARTRPRRPFDQVVHWGRW